MTKEETLKAKMDIDDLNYIVMQQNGKIVAMFLRRWEAEKFIEASKHNYKLVIE